MVSKNIQKLIHSLAHKKYRLQNNLFVAEGPKVVGDLLKKMQPKMIVSTNEWLEDNSRYISHDTQTICVSPDELRQVSFLQHPQQVLALFPLQISSATEHEAQKELMLALDGVQDPGNLGTIIRIADWFGIKNILCSKDTADAFSPKVVQATMGSIARVGITYCNLEDVLSKLAEKGVPLYGTLLDGNNIYHEQLSDNGVIVMGNEGNGISESIRGIISHKLLIPSFAKNDDRAESLNVAIATAITLSEFRR